MSDIGQKTIDRLRRLSERLESGEPIEATEVTHHEAPDGTMHTRERIEFVVVSPCGHPLKLAKNTGTPSWQNRWTCGECGRNFSR